MKTSIINARSSPCATLVSETSSKETCEGGDVVKARVVQPMVSRDSVSPHQILHTEIFKPFIVWETGHGLLQDMLREGYG